MSNRIFIAVVCCLLPSGANLWAFGKARAKPAPLPTPAPFAWSVSLSPIATHYIELPNYGEVGSARFFGDNLQAALISKLVQDNIRVDLAGSPLAGSTALTAPSAGTTIAVQISINEISFSVGRRGEAMMFGFSRGANNIYNDGLDTQDRNEYPLTQDPGWFGSTFRDYGGLRTGLDLGHEINFDVLFADAMVKQIPYSARFGLDMVFRYGNQIVHKNIVATGDGFYFDVSAQWAYSGGSFLAALTWARTDALLKSFNRVVDAAAKTIVQRVELLAAQPTPAPSPQGVAAMKLASASLAGPLAVTNDPDQSVNAGTVNLPAVPQVAALQPGFWSRLWKNLKGTASLPYRIWRYYQYDQNFAGADAGAVDVARATRVVQNGGSGFWAHRLLELPRLWKQYGLGDRRVVVAVIDSGIDYNHGDLNRNTFWDGVNNSPGWDFISWDPRPFDDHAHGTEVASVVGGGWSRTMGAAPLTTLLAVKVFSPYGQTNSGALLGAFQYAVAAGARVIVCGWATSQAHAALQDAVLTAQAAGVLVVAAAGDDAQDLDTTPYYPASFSKTFDNVVSVAAYGIQKGSNGAPDEAVLWSDETHKLGSGYGAQTVDIAAPGVGVRVAKPRDNTAIQSNSGIAAGFVGGLAALAISQCPRLTPLEFKQILHQTGETEPEVDSQVIDSKVLSSGTLIDYINQHCNSL